MNKMDDLLKKELTSDFVPDASLNASILKQAKEIYLMKHKTFKSGAAAAAVIGILIVGSASVYAASHFLAPAQVANELTESNVLAKAFESENAVNINETQTTAGYHVTLLGIVTGKDLIPTVDDVTASQQLSENKTYAVVAIENVDGSPMPSGQGYKTFCVSPLIHGKEWMEVNNATLNAGVSSFIQDGIQYELLECDNLEIFSEMGVSLGVVSYFGEETSAFVFDKTTGLYSVNQEYDGMKALFELPLDITKADEEAANAYFDRLKKEQMEEAVEEAEDVQYSDNPEVNHWIMNMSNAGNSTLDTWNFVLSNAKTVDKYTQAAKPDKDGFVTFKTQDGFENRYNMNHWSHANGVEVINTVQSDGTMEGTFAETIVKNEDGTFTLLRYVPANE